MTLEKTQASTSPSTSTSCTSRIGTDPVLVHAQAIHLEKVCPKTFTCEVATRLLSIRSELVSSFLELSALNFFSKLAKPHCRVYRLRMSATCCKLLFVPYRVPIKASTVMSYARNLQRMPAMASRSRDSPMSAILNSKGYKMAP